MSVKHLKTSFVLLMALLPFFATDAFSQSIVTGKVQDAFLKAPLPKAKVSLLLAADSTVVIDSIPLRVNMRGDGTVGSTDFWLNMEKKTCKYLLHTTLDGYEDCWVPLSIDGNNEGIWMIDDPIELRRMRQTLLGEAEVTATRVKMYYKGDTLVYNADAFKLPDGSMLDGLIRQLPGVTMDDDGQIFVNGRKVDELLLGSRTFMRGNSKVLLENLPYYTVKDIKVYEKQTAMSEAMGRDVESRDFVMDINLKAEYQVGYIGNLEAAAGTEERWLGRGFLLGFTRRWRYSLQANANNVNESRHIGSDGHWTPTKMPKSLLTTRSVAANANYQSDNKRLTNDLTVDYTSTDTRSEMRQRYEQFLEGSRPTSLTETANETDNWSIGVQNELMLTKPSFLQANTNFHYRKWNGSGVTQFNQWDDSLTASMRTDALSKGRGLNFFQMFLGAFSKNNWYTNYSLNFSHNNSRSWQSGRYDTWQAATQANDVSHNAGDVSNKSTEVSLGNYWRFYKLLGKVDLAVRWNVRYADSHIRDYLYHPDTLVLASQLDMLTAITDPSNSYDSRGRQWHYTAGLKLYQGATVQYLSYDRWSVGLDVPVIHRSLDYQRAAIDTLMRHTGVYPTPRAEYNYMSPDLKKKLVISADYQCSPADLVSQIAYRDDSAPLVVKEGNPDLKGTSWTNVNADYTRKFGTQAAHWHAGATFTYRHRDVAQSVAYNALTGVYTYKPMNVSGAYSATAKFDISSIIDKKRYWTWQMNADAAYHHALDHAMLAGETESHVNAVNTLRLHDGAYLQYAKGALNIRVKGDVSWRRSEGRMYDFETLSVTDFHYGLSGHYTVPVLKTTIAVDATMYSRRGYGSADLNTDDFVVNASLSQSFLKGKLTARIEAFDLLHQLSATQYEVNAQGRTETWYRSLPNYVMAHVVFHFNKNPKGK